jgi:hypothetical protein
LLWGAIRVLPGHNTRKSALPWCVAIFPLAARSFTDSVTTVQALGSHRCAQHLTGAVRHRYRFENALHAATSLDRQTQGHCHLRFEATVSATLNGKTRTQTYISPRRIIVIAIYRLLSLRDFRATTEPFLDRIVIIAWTQGEMTYSLVTAVLPTLMPFLIKMNTGLGAFSRDDFIKQTTHQESGGSYVMQSLRSPQGGSRMRSDNVDFQSMVVSQKEPRRSISSDDSQRVMVRKSVDVTYTDNDKVTRLR